MAPSTGDEHDQKVHPHTQDHRRAQDVAAAGQQKARLIARLQNPRGVDVATLSAEVGWQPHSTRAALTGLRKEGYTIERLPSEPGKPARYRITGAKG